ncbi:synaptopodin-2-like isoform X2 [Watersipora subatra]|uniref:synaptopodin-2-like isoform X2 n=1 Tax=Watersipora subatra TaxID=2589382 RepID=UPI00355BB342
MSKGERVSVELVGGPPWGFRLGGGADFGCALEIAKLRKNSKAAKVGLTEGDVVTVIDHQRVDSKSHGDAMKIIELAGPTLRLEIIKGVGPSAELANSSMTSDSFTTSQSEGKESLHQTRSSELKVQESNIGLSSTPSPPRRSSTPQTLTIIPSSHNQKEEEPKMADTKPAAQEPWTVDVTSYEFAKTPDGKSQTLHPIARKQPPPTSPKPKFKANTLPRKSASKKSSCPVLPSWETPPTNPNLQHVQNLAETDHPDTTIGSQSKAAPIFKVAKVDAKLQKWQPTSMKNIAYDDPRHKFNDSEMTATEQKPPATMSRSFEQPNHVINHSPAFSTVPEPPPPPALSPRRPANHIPGMVNPLICDDSQGDFGTNNLVRPDKKIYSDSAFYDSPMTVYPTIQEQVALAKEISNFLESNQNKRSRGGRMFTKRKQRAEEWSMNSQGQRRNIQQVTPHDSLDSGIPKFSMHRKEFGYNQVRHHPDPIKSKIDAAELEVIQHNQNSLCKHDTLPPNIAFDVNEALATSHGKAGQFFERRRQRAEKYIVDENNRKNWQPQASSNTLSTKPSLSSVTRPYKSPWEAAAEGKLESAFEDMPHNPAYQKPTLHSPAIQRPAESSSAYQKPVFSTQQYQPLNVITNHADTSSPGTNVKYKTFKPVNPVIKSTPSERGVPSTCTPPKQKTRLELMLEGSTSTTSATCINNSNNMSNSPRDAVKGGRTEISVASNLLHNQPTAYSSVSASSLAQPPSFTINLKRPKDYLQSSKTMSRHQSSALSAF